MDFANFRLLACGIVGNAVHQRLVALAGAQRRDQQIDKPCGNDHANRDQPCCYPCQRPEAAIAGHRAVEPDDDADRHYPDQRYEALPEKAGIGGDIGAKRVKRAKRIHRAPPVVVAGASGASICV